MEDGKLEALIATLRKELRHEFEAVLEASVAAEVEARLAEAVKQLDGKAVNTTQTNAVDGTERALVDPTGALGNILCLSSLGTERPRGESLATSNETASATNESSVQMPHHRAK